MSNADTPTTAPIRKTGSEPFHHAGGPLGFNLLDFWQWADSDLIGNALRGVLAEYIVARALGLAQNRTRTEWNAFDLVTPTGIKIEVKSAAYVQSWAQEKPSTITFGIQPTLGWDAATNTSATVRARQADVYVFALLHHPHRQSIDALNLDHWEFYVLRAAVLNERCATQKTISLSSLLRFAPRKAPYDHLPAAIAEASAGLTPAPV